MLSSLRKCLLFALLAVLPAAVQSVYEDQHQEYDWQITNIGPSIDNVLFKVRLNHISVLVKMSLDLHLLHSSPV